MKYLVFITFILFPSIAFGQNGILFEVNISDSTEQYFPLEFLNLEMSFVNNTQGRLQYYPFQTEKNDFLFSETTLKVFIKDKEKGEVQKAKLFGIKESGKPEELLKGRSVNKHGLFFPICDDKPCFIKPGEYRIIVEFHPFHGGNKNQIRDELIVQDSLDVKIHSYLGNDHQAFKFLIGELPKVTLKDILSIKYYKRNAHPAFIFLSYPELVPIYESFVNKFPDSSFTPWIMIRLAYAYLFDPSFSKQIKESPNFKKSETYLKQLESYEIAKTNEKLKRLIRVCYFEIGRTQKLFNRYIEKKR
ncbi:MAG: hypothetical protein MK226_24190 [Saprospiraceae bacterium]|nr:hypothetical protein [Saprospiraceae bacterium]